MREESKGDGFPERTGDKRMGLSRALFAGISGLKGQQVKLDIIGNNIAKVNTAGFKRSSVTFSDLFSDTVSEGNSPTDRVGGQNPSQFG